MSERHKAYLSLDFADNEAKADLWHSFVQWYLNKQNVDSQASERHVLVFEGQDLDALVKDFLDTYGGRLWPAKFALRQHLTEPKLRRASKSNEVRRSWVYVQDAYWNAARRSIFRKTHGGREPTEQEIVVGSQLGKGIKAYFRLVLVEGVAEVDVCDPEQLLEEILSGPNTADKEPQVDSSREELADRTQEVAAEEKLVSITPENKRVSITQENKRVSITPGNKRVSITQENKRVSIKAENGRVSIVPEKKRLSINPENGRAVIAPENMRPVGAPEKQLAVRGKQVLDRKGEAERPGIEEGLD